MLEQLQKKFHKITPKVDFCSLRYVAERSEKLIVRQNITQPVITTHDIGIMITVIDKGGIGYAATSDLSDTGLHQAIQTAQLWAQYTQGRTVADFSKLTMPHRCGQYHSVLNKEWSQSSIADKLTLLHDEATQAKIDDRIVDWEASLWFIERQQLYITNYGGEITQIHHYLLPNIIVTANHNTETQRRSLGALGYCRQGGLETLEHIPFHGQARHLAEQSLELLTAPNCPTEKMTLILDSDQMMLQIHESIGHPLELDRILGDERNYAGTSFVTLNMFGNYQYGSPLLNVTFDPNHTEQMASYGFDDEGLPAEKTYVIQEGILKNPLGGITSQGRAQLNGTANSRATNWNRPPIDRMANLNVEPGNSRFEDMIKSTEHGIFMQTNLSWSIDDSRNKFQFGCEWGQLIENGKLTQVVKNPNYRGISATFWRNLAQVGNTDTFKILGTPFCGKGEPNQVIRVGHASPICAFTNVDVFGGE